MPPRAKSEASSLSATTLLVAGGVVLLVLSVGGLGVALLLRGAQESVAEAPAPAGEDSLPQPPGPHLAAWRPPVAPAHSARMSLPQWGEPVSVLSDGRPAHQHAWLMEETGVTALAELGALCSRGPVSLIFSPDESGESRLVLEIESRHLTCHGLLRAGQVDVAALEPARGALVAWRDALVARHPELGAVQVGLFVSDARGGVQLWDEAGGFTDCIYVDGEPACFGDAPRTLFPMDRGMLQGRALSVLGG